MVCQYDVEIYQKIEAAIGKKLEEWPHEKDQVMVLKERVDEAKRIAEQEIKVWGLFDLHFEFLLDFRKRSWNERTSESLRLAKTMM